MNKSFSESAQFCSLQARHVENVMGEADHSIRELDIFRGGYIPNGVVMRETRRLQELAYIALDHIKKIQYSIREWDDPRGECTDAADQAERDIGIILSKFPRM